MKVYFNSAELDFSIPGKIPGAGVLTLVKRVQLPTGKMMIDDELMGALKFTLTDLLNYLTGNFYWNGEGRKLPSVRLHRFYFNVHKVCRKLGRGKFTLGGL